MSEDDESYYYGECPLCGEEDIWLSEGAGVCDACIDYEALARAQEREEEARQRIAAEDAASL